jgi:hypothetical protein
MPVEMSPQYKLLLRIFHISHFEINITVLKMTSKSSPPYSPNIKFNSLIFTEGHLKKRCCIVSSLSLTWQRWHLPFDKFIFIWWNITNPELEIKQFSILKNNLKNIYNAHYKFRIFKKLIKTNYNFFGKTYEYLSFMNRKIMHGNSCIICF